MNTMQYSGYMARVEFDERDNIFVGRVLGVNSIISFHGESVVELRAAFVEAVDDYLADCNERGVAPDKPASGKLMLRLDPGIHAAISIAASAAGESINQWSEEVLGRAAREVLEHAAEAPKAKAAKRPRKPATRKAPAHA
jgi:predicted HicB family RNase H-like nuclease